MIVKNQICLKCPAMKKYTIVDHGEITEQIKEQRKELQQKFNLTLKSKSKLIVQLGKFGSFTLQARNAIRLQVHSPADRTNSHNIET